ncbi:hypothetical protein KI387_014998, partial [Taxus chinensis]
MPVPTRPPSVTQPPSVPCKWAPQTKTTDQNFILEINRMISEKNEDYWERETESRSSLNQVETSEETRSACSRGYQLASSPKP